MENPPRLVSGMTMETCRDQGHTAMGLAAIVNAAETALIQGVDLYSSESAQLMQAAELQTEYLNGAETPEWLCNGTLQAGGYGSLVTYEILYNHFANRLDTPLPNTREWRLSKRTGVHHAMLHMDWETLTHSGTGMVGLAQPGSSQIEIPTNDAPETNPSEMSAEVDKDDSSFWIPGVLERLIRMNKP
jgi:hypothetical protein